VRLSGLVIRKDYHAVGHPLWQGERCAELGYKDVTNLGTVRDLGRAGLPTEKA
jgi:hypothetical protein